MTPEVRDQLQQVIDDGGAALRPRAARHRRRHLRRGAVHRVAGRRGAGGGDARADLDDRRLRHHQGAGRDAGAPRRCSLVVNQTRRPGEGRAVRQQLQQVVDRYVNPGLAAPVRLDLLGEVPVDPAVREAVQRRQLLLESLPGAPAALALVAVATRLVATRLLGLISAAGVPARAASSTISAPAPPCGPLACAKAMTSALLHQPALHLGLQHRLAAGRAMALAVHHAHAAPAARAASRMKAASARAPRRGAGRAGRSGAWIAQWPRRSRVTTSGPTPWRRKLRPSSVSSSDSTSTSSDSASRSAARSSSSRWRGCGRGPRRAASARGRGRRSGVHRPDGVRRTGRRARSAPRALRARACCARRVRAASRSRRAAARRAALPGPAARAAFTAGPARPTTPPCPAPTTRWSSTRTSTSCSAALQRLRQELVGARRLGHAATGGCAPAPPRRRCSASARLTTSRG